MKEAAGGEVETEGNLDGAPDDADEGAGLVVGADMEGADAADESADMQVGDSLAPAGLISPCCLFMQILTQVLPPS